MPFSVNAFRRKGCGTGRRTAPTQWCKGFIFTTDALFALVTVFALLGLLATVFESRNIEIHQNFAQKANDAAIVGLYLGKDAPALGISGISPAADQLANFSSCATLLKYSGGTISPTSFCASGG